MRLMNRVIKPGVKTKVLMLSATPVNNRFYDLRNQLALAYEGDPSEFNEKLNIPKTLKEFGINEDEFKEKVDRIAELAVGDACTGSNPREIDPANMAKLLTCTYYGTEVDF